MPAAARRAKKEKDVLSISKIKKSYRQEKNNEYMEAAAIHILWPVFVFADRILLLRWG